MQLKRDKGFETKIDESAYRDEIEIKLISI